MAPACTDVLRHWFVTQLLGTPEYKALHAQTRLDEASSGVTIRGPFAEQFVKLRDERSTDGDDCEDGDVGGDTDGMVGREGGDPDREMAALRAAGKALAEASEEVREARNAAAAMGVGSGEPGSNDPRAIAALYRRVRGDPNLRRIC